MIRLPFRLRLRLGPALAVTLAVVLLLPQGTPYASAAASETGAPLSGIDPAVAAALTAYAGQIGEPLSVLAPVSENAPATGAQAIRTLTLDNAAQPAASLEALASLPDVETLTVEGGALGSLKGLENHPSLRTLILKDCPALDLTPLTGCSRLSAVTLAWSAGFAGSGAYDLTPLTGCPRLNALTLGGACVTNLAPVAEMTGLQRFSATGLAAATDFSPVGTLANLAGITLYGATAAQVESAFAGLGRKLASAYLGDCELSPEANAAILKCRKLKSLGFDNVRGVDATAAGWGELDSLLCLEMKGGTLGDLQFLSAYTDTVGVKLTDVTVGEPGTVCTVDFDKYFLRLADVPSAEVVRILSGPKRRWNYATLCASREEIAPEVIAALAGVKGLQALEVQNVAPEAFTAETWRGFDSLRQLKLLDCRGAKLGALSGLSSLSRLILTGCTLAGEDAVSAMRKLSLLSLNACAVSGWGFLNELACARTLETLSIAGCDGPESLAFAARLTNLSTLAVEDAPVTDLTPLSGLSALERLSVYGCPIADFTALAGLPGLKRLNVAEGIRTPGYNGRTDHRRLVGEP